MNMYQELPTLITEYGITHVKGCPTCVFGIGSCYDCLYVWVAGYCRVEVNVVMVMWVVSDVLIVSNDGKQRLDAAIDSGETAL